MLERSLRALWESDDAGARAARALLAPLGFLFSSGVALRNAVYDRGLLRVTPPAIPSVGVGNLTVGGTGKTPVAAWIATQLLERGARPAIVLRGYGGDETLVHQRLNPHAIVIADPDRRRGVERAAQRGATVAVLDDGYQHRAAGRDADIVLISADRFGPVRALPAGPWREPLSSLKRATHVVVTRKSASGDRARDVLASVMPYAPAASPASLALVPGDLVDALSGDRRPCADIAGREVLAISAIGDPRAFEAQLVQLGARVTAAAQLDHHRFSSDEAAALARRTTDRVLAVCTLKDAVKLAPLWPREASPLLYLSQRVSVEIGGEALDGLVAALAARKTPPGTTTPARAGPTIDTNVA